MNKFVKKLLVGILAGTMVLGSVTTAFAATGSATVAPQPEKQTEATAEKTSTGIVPTVNTKADGTATITEIEKTSKKTVTVSSKVTVDGVEYKVTKISEGTFANCKKMTSAVLPSTVTSIGSKAFAGASKLKTIKLSTTKKVTVSKTAFKGVDTKKMTIKVSKKMSAKNLKALKKSLKAAGYKGKIKVA